MNYYDAIKLRFPEAIFSLRDDGKGVYIENWEDESPKPDLDSLKDLAIHLEELVPAAKMAKNYLDSTDWYVVRRFDVGTAIPEGVSLLREEARNKIRAVRALGLIV